MTGSEEAQLRLLIIRAVAQMPAEQLLSIRDQVEAMAGESSDLADWVPVSEAAIQLGMTAGHLRRLCIDRLQFDGSAKVVRSMGCRSIWMVRRSQMRAHSRALTRTKGAEEQWKSLPISIVQFVQTDAEIIAQPPVSNNTYSEVGSIGNPCQLGRENPENGDFVPTIKSCC